MPETRSTPSKRSQRASNSEEGKQGGKRISSPGNLKESSPSNDEIEDLVIKLQAGILKLRRETKSLRERNSSLQDALEAAKDVSNQRTSKRGQPQLDSDDDKSLADMRMGILEKKVKQLIGENRRQARRIEKLKATQIEAEVNNLRSGDEDEGSAEIDAMSRMRTLLRKFSDLMLVTTVDNRSDACCRCCTILVSEKCSAMQCEHLICHLCLPKVSKGADETVKCPQCEEFTKRDDLELVHWTEKDRWDALVDVAKAWVAFGNRGEVDTSEEEDEENFFTDGDGASEYTSGRGDASYTIDETTSEPANVTTDDDGPSHPSSTPTAVRQSFSKSPAKQKRKMMEQLAEERSKKRNKHV